MTKEIRTSNLKSQVYYLRILIQNYKINTSNLSNKKRYESELTNSQVLWVLLEKFDAYKHTKFVLQMLIMKIIHNILSLSLLLFMNEVINGKLM